MAPVNRSAGRARASPEPAFHQINTPMTKAKLIALSRNGAQSPTTAMTNPPTAGPMARLTFMPTEFKAMACRSSDRGTSCGTMAYQAGAMKAAPVPMAKVNINKSQGFITPR